MSVFFFPLFLNLPLIPFFSPPVKDFVHVSTKQNRLPDDILFLQLSMKERKQTQMKCGDARLWAASNRLNVAACYIQVRSSKYYKDDNVYTTTQVL